MNNESGTGNIILIGMPGAGKSTLGVLLARTMGMEFVDTDILLQSSEGKRLPEIIRDLGLHRFVEKEARLIRGLSAACTVVATGGSVVLDPAAMEHLARSGRVVYLKLDLDSLEKRIRNIGSRGIVMEPGQTLKDVFEARALLYEKYADIEIDCSCKEMEDILSELEIRLGE